MRRRGVSPVIATVIMGAVAITATFAVAYWVGGYKQETGEPKQSVLKISVLKIGDSITGFYHYTGFFENDTIVIGYGDRNYFLPLKYNYDYHVLNLNIKILKFDIETFELTISWIPDRGDS